MTLEQQEVYVKELRALWENVSFITGYDAPQEIGILDLLSIEDDRLTEMREAEDENA